MTSDGITQRDLQNAVQSATIGVQVAEVIKDLGALNQRMDQHERAHENELQKRISARRWAIGWCIAALIALEAPLIAILASLPLH